MQTAVVQTQKLSGLDYRVWLVMLVTWLFCLGFYAYQKIAEPKAGSQSAAGLGIVVNGREKGAIAVCEPNRIAIFQIPAVASNARVEWDFDDGTTLVGLPVQRHRFAATGSYRVVARVAGGSEYVKEVMVKTPLVIERQAPEVKIFPDSSNISPFSAVGFTAVANFPVATYEWNVLGTNEYKSGERVEFSFPMARKYTVQLVVNGDPATATSRVINVVSAASAGDAPPVMPSNPGDFTIDGPLVGGDNSGTKKTGKTDGESQVKNEAKDSAKTNAAPPAKALEIDSDTFKGLLQQVLDGKPPAVKLISYLDYGESTKVEVNGAENTVNFDAFCTDYRGRKIQTLSLQKDNFNSIQVIKLKIKLKWYEKINPFKKK